MLPDQKPPQEVVDLVRAFQSDRANYELIIHDNLFLLHEKTIITKDGEPDQVVLGSLVRRAYWRDAAGLSLDLIKSRLGIR